MYTEDITDMTERHNVQSHLYADDTQLHDCCRVEHVSVVRSRLTSCVREVAQWCASRRLQLNSDKTEAMWFGSKANLVKLKAVDCSLSVSSETFNQFPSFVT